MTNTTVASGLSGSLESKIAFYISFVICILMGVVSFLGNGLVVYISRLKKDTGKFQYVNKVVKHLALSDFLYGLIGIPFNMLFWWWG